MNFPDCKDHDPQYETTICEQISDNNVCILELEDTLQKVLNTTDESSLGLVMDVHPDKVR
jgi:hypothetical protein